MNHCHLLNLQQDEMIELIRLIFYCEVFRSSVQIRSIIALFCVVVKVDWLRDKPLIKACHRGKRIQTTLLHTHHITI